MGSDRPSVLVAMSGGVDSSAAAIALQSEGFELTGVTMKLFTYSMLAKPDLVSSCCSLEDTEDAKTVARKLGFPHYTFNFVRRFESCVMQPFCEGYLRGETPNPCIDCNIHLKFGGLHQRRRELGLDFVATGHYARVTFDEETGLWQLRRPKDHTKDQSYMLYHLSQEQLAHTLFPLGEMTKSEARKLVAERGLGASLAGKPESQDICFAPDGDHIAFIEHRLGATPQALRPGPIVDNTGKVLGQHNGIARYTIGQRKGLGIAAPEPLYVISKDAEANSLTVGPAAELMTTEARAHSLSFVSGQAPEGPIEVQVKTSYRQPPQPATAEVCAPDQLAVTFREPVRRPAPGQSLVLYQGEVVVWGGIVASPALRSSR